MCKLFFLLLLFGCNYGRAQFSEKYFKKTTWACANYNGSLFKVDTVKFLRINGPEDLADYYKTDFMTLTFLKGAKLKINQTSINEWTTTSTKGTFSWKFERRTLQIFLNGKPAGSFEVLSENTCFVKTKYANRQPIKTNEILLKRDINK